MTALKNYTLRVGGKRRDGLFIKRQNVMYIPVDLMQYFVKNDVGKMLTLKKIVFIML